MKVFITFIVLFLVIVSSVVAQVLPRYDTTCGLLLNRIYCFGGTAPASGNKDGDASINMLDIVNNSGSTSDQLQNLWVTINNANTNGVNLQARAHPQGIQLPDGKSMLLSGGWNTAYSSLDAQTIVFNAENNSWSSYISYTEPPFGVRQIYYASTVYVPSKGIGFYGGMETNKNNNWTYNGRNMSIFDDTSADGDKSRRYIGYTSLTFLDISSNRPWSIASPQTNVPSVFGAMQASVFDAKNNLIYYLGGRYRDANANFYYYSFTSATTYNIVTGNWSTQSLGGTAIPTPRSYHTATLLTSTQRDVLLFGGDNNDNNNIASADYCYTLNLDTFQWKQQNLAAAPNTVLARTDHSAVLVNNNTVFIVFGKDGNNVATSSLLILNVTNPTNVTLLDKYVDKNAPPPPSPGATSGTGAATLSTGAIAGIAVGAAVAGLLAIVAIILCIRHKRKNKKEKIKQEEEALEFQRQKHSNNLAEEAVMEVNWDEIDKKYVEMPTSNFGYSPRLTDDTTTVVDGVSEISSGSPMLIQRGLDIQRPNAIVEEEIAKPFQHPQIQKPDGA